MRTDAKPRIAIYFRMFSPYILSRINAAADVAQVTGIEGSRRSTTYAWDPILGSERFERVTLFEDRAVESVPNAEIIAAVDAVLDASDPAVVVVGGWSHVEAIAMIGWARRHKRPVVLMSESSAHDTARSPPKEWLKKKIVGLADAALVGGQPQAAYMAELGIDPTAIFLGYDAVDNKFFARQSERALGTAGLRQKLRLPARYFLASARFIEKKNFRRMISAFAAYRSLQDRNAWDLVILGDGPLRQEMQAQVAIFGLKAHVHFPGFRQYDELPGIYAFASAFIHVSISEQWGLVVNEAMAAGLPVIVSRQCGCSRDLVRDGVNGYLVDAFSVEALTKRMVAMAEADRASMAAAGCKIIAEYGPERFASGLAAAIEAAQTRPARSLSFFGRMVLRLASLRDTSPG